jgi:acyl-CoA synthetase (AMP-forming)/AMP-acid ligase II
MNAMYSRKDPYPDWEFPSLIHLLSERSVRQSRDTAYTFCLDGEGNSISLTYQELDRKARKLGSVLQQLGLTGERALLMYPSGLDFIIGFLGCLYAGVIAVPAYPPRRNQSLDRLQAIVADCQAREVLTTTNIWQSLERSLSHYPELTSLQWLATDNLVNHFSPHWQPPNINEDSLAFLQYTSGSTGTPKGVMVSHGNLIHNSRQIYQSFGHHSGSRGLVWLPPYHDMGLIGGIIQPIYGGFPITLMSPVDFLQKPFRWLDAISKYQVTTSGGPNFAYDLCVRKVTPEQLASLDLSSWEVAFTGAEPVRAETLTAFAEKFAPCGFRKEAFYPCYGMAEATLFISGGGKYQAPVIKKVEEEALAEHRGILAKERRIGIGKPTKTLVSCGRAWGGQKIFIVDPDTLMTCPTGQVGEIWVSGASVAKGYWNQPDKTVATFHAYLQDTGEGPFLRTGDLGFLQEDGELFVTGRIKDIIIIRGRNHYPQDIERTVEQAHPALKSSSGAAFAVEVTGEEKLVIVQEVERTYLKRIAIQEVIGNIRQSLTVQHGLQVYEVALIKPGSLPKTSSGKTQRFLCRSKFLAGQLECVQQRTRQSRCPLATDPWNIQQVV